MDSSHVYATQLGSFIERRLFIGYTIESMRKFYMRIVINI